MNANVGMIKSGCDLRSSQSWASAEGVMFVAAVPRRAPHTLRLREVRRVLTGHEEMQRHYSTVGLDEKRAAIAGVAAVGPKICEVAHPADSLQAGATGGRIPVCAG
jgi:hypothetical protein